MPDNKMIKPFRLEQAVRRSLERTDRRLARLEANQRAQLVAVERLTEGLDYHYAALVRCFSCPPARTRSHSPHSSQYRSSPTLVTTLAGISVCAHCLVRM